MSSTYINAQLRRLVTERAGNACEYCRIHADDTFYGCQIDHIISEKHGGLTEAGNLALSCMLCNLHKGSDIASVSDGGELARFFDPRKDEWDEHFVLDGAVIKTSTAIGEVTARILRFNSEERQIERIALIDVGRYPAELPGHRPT